MQPPVSGPLGATVGPASDFHVRWRGVVTGQVFRYPPDHFFSKLLERLPTSIIQNGRSLLAIAFDINCAWIFRSYYDRDRHLDLTFAFRMNQ